MEEGTGVVNRGRGRGGRGCVTGGPAESEKI